MRSQVELYEAIEAIGVAPIDPDRMLARIETGVAARRTARRRQIAIVGAAAAAAVIAVTAVVVPRLGNDRPSAGDVATTPTPVPTPTATAQSPELEPTPSTTLGFTPGPAPEGYTTELAYIQPGLQFFTYEAPIGPEVSDQLTLRLFDPPLPGYEPPQPTGETVTINSVSAAPLTAQVLEPSPTMDEWQYGIGWQIDADTWFTVTSEALPRDAARDQVLATAEEVDFSVGAPLTFPFQLGYVPDGLDLFAGFRLADGDGGNAFLEFRDDPQSQLTALQVVASNPESLENFTPNTTVGVYPAQLSGDEYVGNSLAVLIDGFLITMDVNENYVAQIDDAALRRIAESIVVPAGAAQDVSVWTDQPLG